MYDQKHHPFDSKLSPSIDLTYILENIEVAAAALTCAPTHTETTNNQYSCPSEPFSILTSDELPQIQPIATHELLPTSTHKAVLRAVEHRSTIHHHHPHTIQVQVDGGANRSVTNDHSILTGFCYIKKYPLNGISGDGPAVYCTGMGYLPWKSDTNETVFIKCYYCAEVAETIISPTDVVVNHITDINAWGQYCNVDTGQGWIRLYYKDKRPPITYNLTSTNNLWYHIGDGCTFEDFDLTQQCTTPVIRRLTNEGQYELYQQRLGHPGERVIVRIFTG